MEPAAEPAAEAVGEEAPAEAEETPAPYVPAAIKAHDAKWLIKLGVGPAFKYREHFSLTVSAPTEQGEELAKVRRKLAKISAMLPEDQADFAAVLAGCRQEETALQEQLGSAPDAEAASADAIPGAEPKLLARLNAILGRHQTWQLQRRPTWFPTSWTSKRKLSRRNLR